MQRCVRRSGPLFQVCLNHGGGTTALAASGIIGSRDCGPALDVTKSLRLLKKEVQVMPDIEPGKVGRQCC